MLVHRTAAAVLAGALALGPAGTALASGPETRPDPAATAEQPLTAAQFRVVEHLGELTRLTGVLGRLVQDGSAGRQLVTSLQERLRGEIRALGEAVARTHLNRPAVPPGDSRPARLAAAAAEFRATVDAAGTVSPDARAKASHALLAGLTKLNRAAAAEAGLPNRP